MSSEIDQIVAHYKYLCSAGYEACVTLRSEKGQTRVNLDVNLGFILPPFTTPPPVYQSPPPRRSPGYYRRLKKRRDARQQLDSFNENFNTPSQFQLVASEEDADESVAVVTEEVSTCKLDVVQNSLINNEARADSTTNVVIAEGSSRSEVQDILSVCDEVAETEDATVCSAVEVHSEMVKNGIKDTDSRNIDSSQAVTMSPSMRTSTYGQELPNDARYVSSNGYPLPRLTFM